MNQRWIYMYSPSRYPLPPPFYPIPLGLPSAPGPSTCLMHPTWAGADWEKIIANKATDKGLISKI